MTDEPPTFKCSFNWLHWVLVAACRVFSCGVWDLVPCPGTGPGPLCWELRVLASGPAGNAATSYLKKMIYLLLAVLGLRCCAGFSLAVGRGGCSLASVLNFPLWWLLWLAVGRGGCSLASVLNFPLWWLLWLVVGRGGCSLASVLNFPLWWLLWLGSTGSRLLGCSSCARTWLLRGTWGLPRSGVEPVSPALAGVFLNTAPLRKSFPSLLPVNLLL